MQEVIDAMFERKVRFHLASFLCVWSRIVCSDGELRSAN